MSTAGVESRGLPAPWRAAGLLLCIAALIAACSVEFYTGLVDIRYPADDSTRRALRLAMHCGVFALLLAGRRYFARAPIAWWFAVPCLLYLLTNIAWFVGSSRGMIWLIWPWIGANFFVPWIIIVFLALSVRFRQ
ncbi:hypothetical protein JT358_12795 [Micrococcales bacterium 31B]|nr:hypothetical protein [Micrococcales bacterium 31B]